MNVFLNRKPVFTVKQLERLSNIFDNAGQVIFGIVVLSPLLQSFDKINWLVVVSGIVAMMGCWIMSVGLMKKGK